MRHALALALVGALAAAASAQDDALEQKLQEKLAKDFVRNADWVLDYAAARKAAKDSGKLIFAYFTRSYAP